RETGLGTSSGVVLAVHEGPMRLGNDEPPVHPRVHDTEEVERGAGTRGDLDRDRLVLGTLDRNAVTRLIEACLPLVHDPVDNVVRRAGRRLRVLDVTGDDRVADLVAAIRAGVDLRIRHRQVFLRDNGDRVWFICGF